MPDPVITPFAPSPTGFLNIGGHGQRWSTGFMSVRLWIKATRSSQPGF